MYRNSGFYKFPLLWTITMVHDMCVMLSNDPENQGRLNHNHSDMMQLQLSTTPWTIGNRRWQKYIVWCIMLKCSFLTCSAANPLTDIATAIMWHSYNNYNNNSVMRVVWTTVLYAGFLCNFISLLLLLLVCWVIVWSARKPFHAIEKENKDLLLVLKKDWLNWASKA